MARERRDHGDIRELRQQLGMTQEELAHHLGVTVGTVNRWENGRMEPSRLARLAIARVAQERPRRGQAVLTGAAGMERNDG